MDGRPQAAAGPPLTLGTAGHIDHGKTALVTLLTGRNTDRLPEERERGISIELGYAELVLPGGGRLSVVDVPGHERFVRTMVAGATGIDLFLLVIAADDGVMPQTREHLAIIELLGVRRGVVALSKADAVDAELLALAAADVRDFLAGTPYAGSEIVTVSARDGRGVPDLLSALERVALAVESQRREGPARLPVDRVFPQKGVGTIVTGTLWRGEIKAGDALVVEPGGPRVVARSVQVHDHDVAVVRAGSRAGLNLRGVDRAAVARGVWLVAPEIAGRASRRFDAWVKVLAGGRSLRAGDQVRLHHGTAQFVARVAPLEGREIPAGAAAAAVVRLDADAVVEAHDRFILRSLSPVATIGGGEVLATAPRRWHSPAGHAAFLAALRSGDHRAAVLALAGDRGQVGVQTADLEAAGLSTVQAATVLAQAEADGGLEASPRPREVAAAARRAHLFAPGILAAARAALVAGAAERAAARPERPYSAASELAALTPGLAPEDVEGLLRALGAAGELVAGEGGYAPAGGDVLGEQREALAGEVCRRLDVEPFAPPTLASLSEEVGRPVREVSRVLDVLARRGATVRVGKELWFSAAAVGEARASLLEVLDRQGSVTLAGFRDRLGCGRRNAQALLEYFDAEGLTLRRGDERVARRRRS